ncbi:MAG: peptidyl-prolyl cis-trans isomerase [Myxococcales bacterium]|nr:peptidyl-prolyl cis-trans isomerase [Myxococcales bacterium]
MTHRHPQMFTESPLMARFSGVIAPSALLAMACLVLSSCGKPERPTPKGPGVQEAAKKKTIADIPKPKVLAGASALTAEQRSVPLATIGKRIITLGDLEDRLQLEPEAIRIQYRTLTARKKFLLKWVQFEVMAEEARRQGLDKDPRVLDAAKQQMVRRLVQQSVLGTISHKSITDADVKAYYDNNQRLYHKPLQVEVRHIVLSDRKRAQTIHDELQAGSQDSPAKLAALWKDYIGRVTEDKASIPYLGTLGMVSKTLPKGATQAEIDRLNAIPMSLREAAIGMETYTLSKVIQSPRGYHILYAVSRSPAVDKPLKQVSRSIRQRLLKRKRDLGRKAFIDNLMTDVKVEYNDDAIRLLPTPKIKRRKPTKRDLKAAPGGDHHGHSH